MKTRIRKYRTMDGSPRWALSWRYRGFLEWLFGDWRRVGAYTTLDEAVHGQEKLIERLKT